MYAMGRGRNLQGLRDGKSFGGCTDLGGILAWERGEVYGIIRVGEEGYYLVRSGTGEMSQHKGLTVD